jgi:hypothetical protein
MISFKAILIVSIFTLLLSIVIEFIYSWRHQHEQNANGFSTRRWIFTMIPLYIFQFSSLYLWKRFSSTNLIEVASELKDTMDVSTTTRRRRPRHSSSRGGSISTNPKTDGSSWLSGMFGGPTETKEIMHSTKSDHETEDDHEEESDHEETTESDKKEILKSTSVSTESPQQTKEPKIRTNIPTF